MVRRGVGSLWGFDIPNPPEIKGPGQFESAPPRLRVLHRNIEIPTRWVVDHDDGPFGHSYSGSGWVMKVQTLTLDFHWEVLSEMQAEAVDQDYEVEFTKGITTTDSTSFSQSIAAEAGAAGKGLSGSLSTTLSETSEHSVTVEESVSQSRTFTCPAYTTVQVWQLVATFTNTQFIPPFDVGASIDAWDPPYIPGTTELVVRTERTVSHSFPPTETTD